MRQDGKGLQGCALYMNNPGKGYGDRSGRSSGGGPPAGGLADPYYWQIACGAEVQVLPELRLDSIFEVADSFVIERR